MTVLLKTQERAVNAISYTLDLLKQIADGLARQFGIDCEIVIHDLTKPELEHCIVHINNGHVTNRQEGGGPSKVVLQTIHKDAAQLKDRLGYLTRTPEGKILKSSTFYIRSQDGTAIDYLFSINYDISGLMTIDRSLGTPKYARVFRGAERTVDGHQPADVIIDGKQVVDGRSILASDVKCAGFEYLALRGPGQVSQAVF